MSWLAKSHTRFGAATVLAAIAAGCGHPPLTAYATPHPIMPTAAAAPAPNAEPAVQPVTSPSEPALAPTDAIDAASE